MEQKETIKINDVELSTNPTDIKLLDDNYVVDESFIRSSGVFAMKSKYANTKISVTIAIPVTDLLVDADSTTYETTPAIFKVIAQLNNYPFCFIKSKRIETYITPTNVSSTGFLMFAVDELNLTSRAEASNIMFMELVLVYFDHTPLVKDFKFAKYINVETATDVENYKFEGEYTQEGVNDLSESQSWKRYFNTILTNINANMIKYKLKNTDNTYYDLIKSMEVKIGLPLVTRLSDIDSQEDLNLVDGETKFVISTNTETKAHEAYEALLTSAKAQDFSRVSSTSTTITDAQGVVNAATKKERDYNTKVDAKLKEIVARKKASDSSLTDAKLEVILPSLRKQAEEEVTKDGNTKNAFGQIQSGLRDALGLESDYVPPFETNMQYMAINWEDLDLTNHMQFVIHSITVRRKNKLALNHIGSHRFPVIQYMGRATTDVYLQFSGNTQDQYVDDRGTINIVKDAFNILDLNRSFYPEMTAFNHLKIKSLPTILLGAVDYLPNQCHIGSSSSEQGVDSFSYTFTETNMEEFLKMGELQNSGKNSNNQLAEFSHDSLIAYLTNFKQLLTDADAVFKLSAATGADLRNMYFQLLKIYEQMLYEYSPDLERVFKEKSVQQLELLIDKNGAINVSAQNKSMVDTNSVALGVSIALQDVQFNSLSGGFIESTNVIAEALVSNTPVLGAIFPKTANSLYYNYIFNSYTVGQTQQIAIETPAINRGQGFEEKPFVPFEAISGYPNNKKPSFYLDKTNTTSIRAEVDTRLISKTKVIKQSASYDKAIIEFHTILIDSMISTLKGRKAIVTNKLGKTTNIVFRERPETSELIKQLLVNIVVAAGQGNPVALKTYTLFDKTFLDLLNEATVSFVGQAIPDIHLEYLQPSYLKDYVEETDTMIQNASPVFFLREEKWVSRNQIKDTYKNIMAIDDAVRDSLAENIVQIISDEPKSDRLAGDMDTAAYQYGLPTYSTPVETVYADAQGSELTAEAKRVANEKAFEEAKANITNAPSIESSGGVIETVEGGAISLKHITMDHNKAGLLAAKQYMSKFSNLTQEEWLLYANGLARVESQYNQQAVNITNGNYIGLYQLGSGGLVDAGFIQRLWKPGGTPPKAWSTDSYWVAPYTSKGFLGSQEQQAAAFAKYTNANYGYLVNDFKAKGYTFDTLDTITKLGLLSAAHLTGHNTVTSMYLDATISKDGNKVSNMSRYTYMVRLQTELKGNIDTTINKPEKTPIPIYEVTVTRVNDAISFVGRDSKGTEKVYYLEGLIAPKYSGLSLSITGAKPVSMEQVDDKLKIQLEELLKTSNNVVNVQETGMNNGGTVAKVTIVVGNRGSVNTAALLKGFGYLDKDYNSNKSYVDANKSAEQNKVGVYALPAKQGVTVLGNLGNALNVKTNKGITFSDAELRREGNVSQFSASTDKGYYLKATECPILPQDKNLYYVTSGFGMRGRRHEGIDIAGNNVAGKSLVSLADGIVDFVGTKNGYGNTIIIKHDNNYSTLYAHLRKMYVKAGDRVFAKTVGTDKQTIIGLVGGVKGEAGSGSSTAATGHLHYEVMYKNVKINPLRVTDLSLAVGNQGGLTSSGNSTTYTGGSNDKRMASIALAPDKGTTVYDEYFLLDKYVDTINKSINVGMSQCFPTMKVYVTVGNEDQDYWQGMSGSKIEYYEIKGIRNFHLNTNNADNPIDVLSMVVADPNFLKTDEMSSLMSRPGVDYNAIGTDYETQFKNNRMKLAPGMKLHVRMGHQNNPNNLDIVFNGSISSCNSNGLNSIQVIAEGFGKELLTDVLGTTEPKRLGGGWNSSTGTIFADLMQLPGIYHFGKTYSLLRMGLSGTLGDLLDPEARSMTGDGIGFWGSGKSLNNNGDSAGNSSIFNSNYYLGFKMFSNVIQRSRIYTNIYASDVEYIDNEFDSPVINLFSNALALSKAITYDFYAVRETPWEVMKQMEHRHPGTIVKPLWYQDRCTLFYGIKEQMYIARDSQKNLMSSAAQARVADVDVENTDSSGALETYAGIRTERMEPVVNFHILSSEINIINNGIKLSAEYFTRVNVGYRDDDEDVSNPSEWDTCEMSLDDNLAPWEIRATDLHLGGCDHRYMAYRYGTTFLLKEAEKMYKGSIMILGNPAIKSGDYAYIQDTTRRMFGIVKVRECFHHFDENTGFTTEIVPGQFVEPAEFTRSNMFLRMGLASKAFMTDLKTNVLTKAFSTSTFRDVESMLTLKSQVSKLARMGTNIGYGDPDDWFGFNLNPVSGVDRSRPGLINNYIDTLQSDIAFTLPLLGASAYMAYLVRQIAIRAIPDSLQTSRNIFSVNAGANLAKAATAVRDSIIGGAQLVKGRSLVLGQKALKLRGTIMPAISAWYNAPRSAALTSRILGAGITGLRVGATLAATATINTALLAARSALLVLSLVNPITLITTVLTTLTLSYVNAKIEENMYTRQPALFYPLIQHGKPYVAGMSGVVRNTYFEALGTEVNKTWAAVQKAATIINNRRAIGEEGRSWVLGLLEKSDAKNKSVTYETDKDGVVLTNIYANDAVPTRQKTE